MYWGMNDWTSPLKSPIIYRSWLKAHTIQSSSFSLLTGGIRCIWPRPPSYTLFPLVPISLYSCFLLLSFLVFICQLFLLSLIIRWWSSGLWPTCSFCFCPSLPHSLSPGKHVQSREDQVATSATDVLLTSRPAVIGTATWLSPTIFTSYLVLFQTSIS